MRDGEMRSEAIVENNNGVETEQRVDGDAGGRGPEAFNISGSPVKEPDEEIERLGELSHRTRGFARRSGHRPGGEGTRPLTGIRLTKEG